MKQTKKLSLLLATLLSCASWSTTEAAAGYTVVKDKVSEKIKTPSLQEVKKQKIRLSNGLEALIVSDPNTPKSGAALAVGVGNAQEPFEKVGLAHFVEHMLFMGNEKYPNEKEYHEFINENGGMTNAYTASDRTVYMYEINNEQMSSALDRFGSFFCTPLFNTSSLSRERQAVDQEFSYRAVMDPLRSYLVLLDQSNDTHPMHNWRCGDAKTLETIQRDELVDWYQSNYGADRMKLVVYTQQPIEEIRAQIVEIFSPIKKSEKPLAEVKGPLLNPSNLGHQIYVKPLKDVRSLTLYWEVDAQYVKDLDFHVMDLVGDALGEEHPTSLATQFKNKGWIQSLQAGGFELNKDIGFFCISMDLTERGVFEREVIIEKVFEAIQGLRQEGIPRYRFEEMVNVAKMNYQYQSRPDVFRYLSGASANLQYESLETYPQKHSWPTKFSQKRNREFLETLKPQNALYIVSAPENLLNVSFTSKEKSAGVDFAKEEINPTQLQAWANAHPDKSLAVAPPNPYVTDHVTLVKMPKQDEPSMLVDEEKGSMYYSPDHFYQVPQCAYALQIHSPEFYPSAQTEVCKDLYSLALQDATAQQADQGSVAGIGHRIAFSSNFSLNVSLYGYSQKSAVYLQKLLEKVRYHRPSEEEFTRYKERLSIAYQNKIHKQAPLGQAKDLVVSVMIKEYISPEDQLDALSRISYADLQKFYDQAFSKTYLGSLFYGNLKPEDAQELYEQTQTLFADSAPYPVSEHKKRSVLDYTQNSSPKFIAKSSSMEGNAAFLMVGQGEMTFKKMAALSVFANSVSTPFFDTLRTKQQTGYVAQSSSQEIEKQLFSFFMVLSNSHSTRDLLSRFELFNEDFLKALNSKEYTEEKFNLIKQSIITQLEQPPKNLMDNGARLVKYAYEYQGDFKFHEKQIAALNDLTFDEFIEYAQTYFGRKNHRRIAGLVDGKLQPENELEYTPIQNLPNYKTQLIYTSADVIAENQKKDQNGI